MHWKPRSYQSNKEQDVLSLVAKDAVNYEIAELLKISENTVKTHLVTYGESACAKSPQQPSLL